MSGQDGNRSGPGLEIVVTWGTSHAPTELAAFDGALHQAGVAQFNLIRLSSLIPPGSRVTVPGLGTPLPGTWGDRLYAVYAEHRLSTPGQRACAGLGWIQDQDSGAGVLVEHHGHDETDVEAQLRTTLDDLATRRPGRYGVQDWRISGITCSDQPVAAVVVAAFQIEPW